jgi:energy-coupling factor transporter transmembrane protein EcfT
MDDQTKTTPLAKAVNNVLGQRILQTVGLVTTGVLAGYCLQPVPDFVNKAFNENFLLKCMVLIIMTMIAYQPMKNGFEIATIIFIVIFLLLIVEGLRYYEDGGKNNHFSVFKSDIVKKAEEEAKLAKKDTKIDLDIPIPKVDPTAASTTAASTTAASTTAASTTAASTTAASTTAASTTAACPSDYQAGMTRNPYTCEWEFD